MAVVSEASSISCFGATRSRAGRGSGKRVRTIFTQEQLDRLEKEFERQQYMVGTERSVDLRLFETCMHGNRQSGTHTHTHTHCSGMKLCLMSTL